jgi:GTP cyclohydrolase II
MNPAQLQAQATQSAQQGQQAYNTDVSQANNYKGQYDTDTAQASQANANLQKQAQYMQGAGSGQNVYNTQLSSLESQHGYNPQSLANANANLFAMNGALNGASQQFNTPGGVGAYGLSAPALAGYESSVLSPLQQGVQNANTQVGTLNNELGTFMTGANQATTSQVQSEQNTANALNQVYANANTQAANAMSQMQNYLTLAQKQGGLNATNAQGYATALYNYQDAIAVIQQTQAALTTANANARQAAIAAQIAPSTEAYNQAQANYYKTMASTNNPSSGGSSNNSSGMKQLVANGYNPNSAAARNPYVDVMAPASTNGPNRNTNILGQQFKL